jgi:hypothetical protein
MHGTAKLVDADPANVRARLDLSIAEGIAGRAACLVGDLPSGTGRLDRVIDGQEKSLKVDATRAELRGALTRHYLWAAVCAVDSKNWNDADRRYQQAADLAAETVAAHSTDANARENLAAAYAHFGKKTEAGQLARNAGAEAQAILSLHPDNPAVRAILDAARTF